MRLEWSPLAIDDRERIFDFIEQDDPRAAILRVLHSAQLWPGELTDLL